MDNYYFVCCDTEREKGKAISPKFIFAHHARELLEHLLTRHNNIELPWYNIPHEKCRSKVIKPRIQRRVTPR